jgi:hypothetical protein
MRIWVVLALSRPHPSSNRRGICRGHLGLAPLANGRWPGAAAGPPEAQTGGRALWGGAVIQVKTAPAGGTGALFSSEASAGELGLR